MGQPITTNPILIALINMTVVFVVLYGLSLLIRVITLIDPTQKKKIASTEVAESVIASPVLADTSVQEEDYDEMILLFTAAIAAYGHSGARIVAIRPVGISTWSQTARMESVNYEK